MESQLYPTRKEARDAAEKLGCVGTHRHKSGKYGPCKSHEEFKEINKKGELGELVDFDGTLNSSQIPIIDPRTSAKGLSTMDKRVAAGHQTQDPLVRGMRVYYGESHVREEDMSNAFGYEETEFMNAEETIDYFIGKLGFDGREAEDRALEMGKETNIPDNPEFEDKKGFIDTMRLVEIEYTKEDIIKMAEDSLVLKSDSKDLTKRKLSDDNVSPIIKRNIKALKNMASADGISVPQLIKMLKNE